MFVRVGVYMSLFTDQILLVNKPLTWTSFDVVRKIKGMFRIKKIGHAGTLDPLAEGLLILAIGKKTKELETITKMDKEYVGTFCLGATTPTLDREMTPDTAEDTSSITTEQIKQVINDKFLGELQQTPPQYSAVKKDGKTAYKEARKGIEIKLEPKTITITEFEVLGSDTIKASDLPGATDSLPDVILTTFRARLVCSKGTYVRVLADDIAKALGTRGYLLALTRTRIGPYKLGQAETMEQLEKQKELLHL
jgi:tRNA pseudouridine55 synthase